MDRSRAKAGAMVSYRGNIKFEREGVLEHGLGKMFKKALTGEGTSLMKANGTGKLYLADQGKKISILHLQGESIFVNNKTKTNPVIKYSFFIFFKYLLILFLL